MLESFVITLREGIEAALVVAATLAYLRRTGRADLNRAVGWGIAAAAAVSLAGALALRMARIDPENEALEGALRLVAALFVLSLVAWIVWQQRRQAAGMEERLRRASASPRQALAFFLFTFVMVGREGIEAVLLLLPAGMLTSRSMMATAGAAAGLVVAVLFGVFFVRGSRRVNLRLFFRVTSVALVLLAAQLLVGAYHEFAEAGILPASPGSMAVVGPLVRHNALFLALVLLVPFWAIAAGAMKKPIELPAADPAQRRLALAAARSERLGVAALGVVSGIAVVALLVHWMYSSRTVELSPPVLLAARDGSVRVPLAEVEDGNLHRYAVDVDGVLVRFLVMKRENEPPAVALDACEICGSFGYYQEGPHVICRNCVAEINPLSIGQEGGCNPIPLREPEARLEGGAVAVSLDRLKKERARFEGGTIHLGCPVCGMKFQPAEGGRLVERGGRAWRLCRMPGCEEAVREDPEKYLK